MSLVVSAYWINLIQGSLKSSLIGKTGTTWQVLRMHGGTCGNRRRQTTRREISSETF